MFNCSNILNSHGFCDQVDGDEYFEPNLVEEFVKEISAMVLG